MLRLGTMSLVLVNWLAYANYAAAQTPQQPPAADALAAQALVPIPPAAEDFTSASLLAYEDQILTRLGGSHLNVPLEAKALYFRWLLERYHTTPDGLLSATVYLPTAPGAGVTFPYVRDGSTWNGSALSALCLEYAVTKDRYTLGLIGRTVRGLHLYQQVTGKYGLAARSVIRSPVPVDDAKQKYQAPDGTVYHYYTEPAKGTYNQLAGGYAALMIYAYDDLPPDIQQLAHADIVALADHLVSHQYRLTEANGETTRYGDMTPRIASIGIPFNAQVCYMIVAAGAYLPAADPAARARLQNAMHELRTKHHVYYEDPRRHLIRPQQIGASPLVKGMNDRFHVTYAAYMGLQLELAQARRDRRAFDATFMYQLGQTMQFSLSEIGDKRNSFVNFMWTGLLSDPAVMGAVVPQGQEAVQRTFPKLIDDGIAQLRHFPLRRILTGGTEVEGDRPVWVDQHAPDEYRWKHNPNLVLKSDGKPGFVMKFAVDYLQAYWMMRLYRLDEHAAAAPHRGVLGKFQGR